MSEAIDSSEIMSFWAVANVVLQCYAFNFMLPHVVQDLFQENA